MKKLITFVSLVYAIAGISLMGCSSEPVKEAASEHHEGDDHDHADHDHADHDHAAHGHSSKGPHGGSLIELGQEEYHAELVHNDETHEITIYILDGAAKQAVPIAESAVTLNLTVDGQPQQFSLPAVEQPGDAEGRHSTYKLASEELGRALDAEGANARLKLTINEKQYVGTVEHKHD